MQEINSLNSIVSDDEISHCLKRRRKKEYIYIHTLAHVGMCVK